MPVGDAPEGVVVDAVTRTVAVAKRNPNELVLIDADTGAVTSRVALPGAVRHLQLAKPGGPVLVPVESANALVRVDLPGGGAEPQIITGTVPHDASETSNGTVFVANEHGGTVTAIRGDQIVKVFTDSVQPAGLASVGNLMGLLDVRKNDLTVYDADAAVHRRVDACGRRSHAPGRRQARAATSRRTPAATPSGCSTRSRDRSPRSRNPAAHTASPTTQSATGLGGVVRHQSR